MLVQLLILLGRERKDIDAYDVIVGDPSVPEEIKSYIGSRTDALYHVVMNQRLVQSPHTQNAQ